MKAITKLRFEIFKYANKPIIKLKNNDNREIYLNFENFFNLEAIIKLNERFLI